MRHARAAKRTALPPPSLLLRAAAVLRAARRTGSAAPATAHRPCATPRAAASTHSTLTSPCGPAALAQKVIQQPLRVKALRHLKVSGRLKASRRAAPACDGAHAVRAAAAPWRAAGVAVLRARPLGS